MWAHMNFVIVYVEHLLLFRDFRIYILQNGHFIWKVLLFFIICYMYIFAEQLLIRSKRKVGSEKLLVPVALAIPQSSAIVHIIIKLIGKSQNFR